MLGVPGQMDLEHYENRLRLVLGVAGYGIALEILTEAAINDGQISDEAIARYMTLPAMQSAPEDEGAVSVTDVMHVLLHDFYLEQSNGGYTFVSNLLRDWWRTRYGQHFVPVAKRGLKWERKL